MANLFTNAVNFFGNALREAVTPDTMRDYQHASRLFVGNNFERTPKLQFLFHVFFDVDPSLSAVIRANKEELGLMVKTIDLPRFTVNSKIMNSYNRPNIVQNKVSFDPVNISFHDDSANIVRNFWYDYYRYHYRDSDYGDSGTNPFYKKYYKYRPQDTGKFGYSLRQESTGEEIRPYLRSVRIYSLHQKRFSEYILINPIIKNFRHGSHQTGGNDTMQHDMTIEYENILYQSGSITTGSVQGFGDLHYDKTRSPLRQYGGVKGIFGTGGLIDTAGSVLADVESGNYASAIFKTAQGINAARSMNLKKSLISELTGIYTAEATRAIQSATPAVIDQVNKTMQTQFSGTHTVPTVAGIEGAVSNKYTGVGSMSSIAALAGAAIILNSTPIGLRGKDTGVVSNNKYNPQLPANPGVTRPVTIDYTLKIGNDQDKFDYNFPQGQINTAQKSQDLVNKINSLNRRLSTVGNESAAASQQINNTTQAITDITGKIAAIQALAAVTPQEIAQKTALLAELSQQITLMNNLKNIAQTTLARLNTEIASLNQDIAGSTKELTALQPVQV